MLFIKQLRAAQLPELESAKLAFFNAELLERDVQQKGVPDEVAELVAEHADVHSLWELDYNDACTGTPDGDELPGLYGKVMRVLRDTHAQRKKPPLGMRVVHRHGAMHQVVENGAAGWTRGFREIASSHRNGS
jgi:hypothetical protein